MERMDRPEASRLFGELAYTEADDEGSDFRRGDEQDRKPREYLGERKQALEEYADAEEVIQIFFSQSSDGRHPRKILRFAVFVRMKPRDWKSPFPRVRCVEELVDAVSIAIGRRTTCLDMIERFWSAIRMDA
jgi:hypothetical protein